MTAGFSIDFKWLPGERGGELERAGFADISIRIGGRLATQVEDVYARTTRESVRTSAVALAEWLAANWWRLRSEPGADTHSWRMSHHLGAIGGGYVWPDLLLDGDGQTMLARCRATGNEAGESVRYLGQFDVAIPAEDFVLGVDEFIGRVLARLRDVGVDESPLEAVWSDVRTERADEYLASFRRREAMLGFDPDEAPEALMSALEERARTTGAAAVDEVASAAGEGAPALLDELLGSIRSAARPARVSDLDRLRLAIHGQVDRNLPPWQQAGLAARLARGQWGLRAGPVSTRRMSEVFDVPEALLNGPDGGTIPSVAAAYRTESSNGGIDVALNRRLVTGRRFALARLVGDHLVTGAEESLLPATDTRTARQKFQRAFAQEFLCPFEDLVEWLGGGRPEEPQIEEAADHFDVSPLLVRSTLMNNGVLTRDILP